MAKGGVWPNGPPKYTSAWDVTVADTFAASYVGDTAVRTGAAAERAAAKEIEKYDELRRNYIFIPLAGEVTGVWNVEAEEFFKDLGSRMSYFTGGEARETSFFVSEAVYLVTEGECCMHAFIDRTLILTGWSDAIWFLLFPKPHYSMLPRMKYWGLKNNNNIKMSTN